MSIHLAGRPMALFVGAVLVAASSATASADATPRVVGSTVAAATAAGVYPIVVAGDFTGDGVDDLFFHSPGAAVDVMYDYSSDLNGDPHVTARRFWAQGTYRPVVGDFTGDFVDDIFWYQPGPGLDVIWDFTASGTAAYTRRPITVNGSYRPVAGDFTDDGRDIGTGSADDVFWYGPGSIPDSIWDFARNGTLAYRSVATNVVGTDYQPVAGQFRFGSEDIFWYSTNGGTESMWDFQNDDTLIPQKYSGADLQVIGNAYHVAALPSGLSSFLPIPDSLVFVGPGAVGDYVWNFDFVLAGYSIRRKTVAPEPLNDNYTVAVGLVDELPVGSDSFDEMGDYFVYNPANNRGLLYDLDRVDPWTCFHVNRYVFQPAPVTSPQIPGSTDLGCAPWSPSG